MLLGQAAFVYKALIAHCDLDGVKILSLYILYDGHFQHPLVVRRTHIGRNHGHSGKAAGPVAALTADNLVMPVGETPDGYGLNQSERAYGGGKFFD